MQTSPPSAVQPPRVILGCSTAARHRPSSLARSAQRRASRVAGIAISDGRAKLASHRIERRRVGGVEHEVRRIGDRQDEARRIGDQGAGEQVRQRVGLGAPGRREHRRRQHHRGGVVGQEGGHDHAGRIDQQEQPPRRSPRAVHGERGHGVEQALLARGLRQQHHADQEEVDVRPLPYGGRRRVQRHEAEHDEQHRARDRPDRLGRAERPDQHAGGGERADPPDGRDRPRPSS